MHQQRTDVFTAREFAEWLPVSRQAVADRLKKFPTAGTKRVGGQEADAWGLADIPRDMGEDLAACAREHGFPSVAAMLRHKRQWKPRDENGREISLNEIPDEQREDAQRLQRALAPSLLRMREHGLTDELVRIGKEDYRREYHHTHEITDRHFRRLIEMVKARTDAPLDWNRWEFFITGQQRRKVRAAKESPEANLAELAVLTDKFTDRKPNFVELKGIWKKAYQEHQRLIAEGWIEEQATRAIRDFLAVSSAFQGISRDALRVQFNRFFADVRAKGLEAACEDGRRDNGEPLEISDDDKKALITVSGCNHRGLLPGAIRALIPEDGTIVRRRGTAKTFRWSAAMRERYKGELNKRGDTPDAIARQCAYEAWCFYMYGLEQFEELTASILRNWNLLPSLRVYSADDLTPPNYFYVPDGRGWFRLVRGQLLVFEDYRSGMILGYSLQPDKNYNSMVIRSLCTYVFAKYGVPQGLYFENGQWRDARLIRGGKQYAPHTLSHEEMTIGLERFGVRFTHTKHQWSKPIEKSFDLLQTLMQAEPGYCGRNEKDDLPPEMKRNKYLVAKKQNPKHPKELGLLSWAEWHKRIGELCVIYNNTIQRGRRCNGKTPAQVCQERMLHDDPNITFTADVLHIIAQHREPRRVLADGINFEFSGRKFSYYGPELSHLSGQWVMTGWDPENPELLTVEDPKTGRAICVEAALEQHPAAKIFDPNGNALNLAHERVAGQVAPLLAYFAALDCQFLPERRPVADAITLEEGRIIRQKRQKIAERKQRENRVAQFAIETGFPVAATAETNREEIDRIANFLKGGN